MSEGPRRPVPIEMLQVGRGYALAWGAPWGAAASVVHRFAPEFTRAPIALDTGVRALPDAPRLFPVDTGIAAVWCQNDGAWLAVLRQDGEGLAREPERVVPSARSLAIAPSPRETHVFVEDGESVRVLVVRGDGNAQLAREPLVTQRGRALLAAARAGETPLLFAVYEDDPRLVVAHGGPERRALVRHDLPARVVALDACGAGARAAVALVYDDGAMVEAGVVDRAGKLIERRHPVLRDPAARFQEVRATWIEDGFFVVARDAVSERAVVARAGSGEVLVRVPRVYGPFAVAYREKALSVAQAFADGDATVLRVTRELRDRSVREVREPAPPSLRVRRAEEQVARCVDELEHMLGASGYRDARAVRVAVPTGAALRLERERQQVELRPAGDAFRLILVCLEERSADPSRDGIVARLARWSREHLSRDARARATKMRAIGLALAQAIGGALAHAERSASGWRFELVLDDAPAAPHLSAWLHHARSLLGGAGLDRETGT